MASLESIHSSHFKKQPLYVYYLCSSSLVLFLNHLLRELW